MADVVASGKAAAAQERATAPVRVRDEAVSTRRADLTCRMARSPAPVSTTTTAGYAEWMHALTTTPSSVTQYTAHSHTRRSSHGASSNSTPHAAAVTGAAGSGVGSVGQTYEGARVPSRKPSMNDAIDVASGALRLDSLREYRRHAT